MSLLTAQTSRRSILAGLPAALIAGVASQAAGTRSLNVRDFGAAGDGRTDDTQALRRAQAAAVATGSVLNFPAGRYSVVGWKDVSNDPVRWHSSDGATIICHGRDILFSSRAIPLALAGMNRRKSLYLAHQPLSVPTRSLLFVSSRQIVDLRRPDPITCQTARVQATRSGGVELDRPLAFDFSASDLGLQCRFYPQPRSLIISGIRFVTAADNPIRAISIVGAEEGLAFADCTFETQNRGDINNAPDGSMIMESIGVAAERLTIRNCRYGYMLSNGSRDCTITGVEAMANRHPIYPAYWSANCTFRDVVGTNNVATVDSHSAFDISYDNVVASNDIEMSNIRATGVQLLNSKIHSHGGDGFKIAFQAWVPQYRQIPQEHVAIIRNVLLDFGSMAPSDRTTLWVGPIGRLIVDKLTTNPGRIVVSVDRNAQANFGSISHNELTILRRS